ncbi:MAG: hypothetical protein LBT00_03630 [Spirochaetaceae bacterium]|nr:hypothetical protein [Spirochaetaceae bacterium]
MPCFGRGAFSLDCFAALAMTGGLLSPRRGAEGRSPHDTPKGLHGRWSLRGRSPKQSRGEGPHTGLLRSAMCRPLTGGLFAMTARSAPVIFHYPFLIIHSHEARNPPLDTFFCFVVY